MPRPLIERIRETIPIGLLVIFVLAGVSSAYVLLRPADKPEGRTMWTFVRNRVPVYQRLMDEWELTGPDAMRVELVEFQALTRRLLSGFFSGTPLADIVEIERGMASAAFRGPLEAVGFIDLTERLHAEGLYERINAASFSPWTNRGRIFGLPADVHPVLLCYRADIFEAAGIDVEQLDTWDKFFAATAPLVVDLTGDGRPDRYVFELQETEGSALATLMLQAGARFFDDDGKPVFNSPVHARVLARLANWAARPDKLTGDLDLFTGAGHQLRAEGYVLSWLVPDWRAIQAPQYIGALHGKLKLMPLPAWEEGGRRTSVWGGTMLGFPVTAPDFEKNWELAKRLYLARDLAVESWVEFGVLTPVKEFWDDPVFRLPSPYFSGQATGQLFIDQAGDVPVRTSSPYLLAAIRETAMALSALIKHAEESGASDPARLEPRARELLDHGMAVIIREMERNIFSGIEEDSP
jgi:arabinosaccharide transport system substrate-binding protein